MKTTVRLKDWPKYSIILDLENILFRHVCAIICGLLQVKNSHPPIITALIIAEALLQAFTLTSNCKLVPLATSQTSCRQTEGLCEGNSQ